jgi:hypothetical protein
MHPSIANHRPSRTALTRQNDGHRDRLPSIALDATTDSDGRGCCAKHLQALRERAGDSGLPDAGVRGAFIPEAVKFRVRRVPFTLRPSSTRQPPRSDPPMAYPA